MRNARESYSWRCSFDLYQLAAYGGARRNRLLQLLETHTTLIVSIVADLCISSASQPGRILTSDLSLILPHDNYSALGTVEPFLFATYLGLA